jgi:hypothetical protein
MKQFKLPPEPPPEAPTRQKLAYQRALRVAWDSGNPDDWPWMDMNDGIISSHDWYRHPDLPSPEIRELTEEKLRKREERNARRRKR